MDQNEQRLSDIDQNGKKLDRLLQGCNKHTSGLEEVPLETYCNKKLIYLINTTRTYSKWIFLWIIL